VRNKKKELQADECKKDAVTAQEKENYEENIEFILTKFRTMTHSA
jgi:hypothetical protein